MMLDDPFPDANPERSRPSVWSRPAIPSSAADDQGQAVDPWPPPLRSSFPPPTGPPIPVSALSNETTGPEPRQVDRSRGKKWLSLAAVFALGLGFGVLTRVVLDVSQAASPSVSPVSPVSPPPDRATRTSPDTAAVSDEPITELTESAAVSPTTTALAGVPLGDLFRDEAFDGEYGALDPTALTVFDGVQPSTQANLDRWLIEGALANIHRAARSDSTDTGAESLLQWAAPAPPQLAWQAEEFPDVTPRRYQFGSTVTITRQTLDGTWVEVVFDAATEPDLVDWIDALAGLATASDTVAPPGFQELPRMLATIQLGYGNADGLSGELAYVTTVQFEADLSELDTKRFLSTFGSLGQPVEDFAGPGTLYRFDDVTTFGAPVMTQFGWVVNPRLIVVAWLDESLVPDGDGASALILVDGSSATPPSMTSMVYTSQGTGNSPTLSNQTLNDDSQVTNIRFGDLGAERFVYFETATYDTYPGGVRCAMLVVGTDWYSDSCTPITGLLDKPDHALCAYQVNPTFDGNYRFTLIADPSIVDQIEVSLYGEAVLDVDMQVASGSTSGTRPWTVKSVVLPGIPTINEDEVPCLYLR